MSERLIVRNFLCLRDIDIEVKDFLVLIGPQAAGKSLCAKLLYFFRTIFVEMALYAMENTIIEKQDFKQVLLDKFEMLFPKDYWSNQEVYIEYNYISGMCFKLEKKKSQELSIDVHQALPLIENVKKTLQDLMSDERLGRLKDVLMTIPGEQTKNKILFSQEIFIPSGRSFFSLLQKNIFRFLRTSNNIDPFLLEFGIFYENIKRTKHGIPVEAQTLVHSILKGDYVPDENLLLHTDNRKISLELLSSGQQEALPLALILGSMLSSEEKSSANIYIEEPEAHLFPDAQEAMSRLISLARHNSPQKTTFVITTHSPYILAAFNNLIKAGNIVKQNPKLKDEVCKEIPESMHIDAGQFSAYTLEDGRAVSIIDKETNLINADAIDGVSENIMETFNTLLDIEFNGGKAGENV